MASTTVTETAHVVRSEILSAAGPKESSAVPRNVHTELSYYTPPPDGGPPLPIYITDTSTRAKGERIFQPAIVYDVRGSGVEHTLDKTGFQFVKHESGLKVEDFDDEEKVKVAYYAETEELLKRL